MASSFDINDETIMTRLLSHFFKGKIVEWFRNMTPQSINTWGELFQDLMKIFSKDIDDNTFVILIACIIKYPHESMDDFNIRFEKT